MKAFIDENGRCDLSQVCPQLVNAFIQWKHRDADIAVLAMEVNGVAIASNLHVHVQCNNPVRDFVMFGVNDTAYRVYRDGLIVTD